MIHRGRNRYRSHAGIPQGSTVAADDELAIYFQANTRESSSTWPDASINGNDATQGTEGNQPAVVDGGGLDFEDSNNSSSASHMDFSNFEVGLNTNFLAFIVCTPEDSVSNLCFLSDTGTEVMQLTNSGQCQLKTGTTSNMTHSSVFSINPDEKTLFMIERTNDGTGTIKLYKQGLVCDGHQNTGSTNTDSFSISNLGVKNNPSSESNWFDGIMYDVGVIIGGSVTARNRNLITDYLCSKHGLERLAND
tara:strand:+ start:152 stop:898 length:747 start_codon:yes stop_codon:yes gene_type:complete